MGRRDALGQDARAGSSAGRASSARSAEPASESRTDPLHLAKCEPWFVYLARCADGSIYTGIAKDVAARIRAHDAGKGAKYTRGRGPLEVCAVRRCASKNIALRLERAVKALPRSAKEALTMGRRFGAFARAYAVTTIE